jgi:CysZ protein
VDFRGHHFRLSAPSPIPDLPRDSSPGDALRGAWLPLRAFVLIIRTPRLLALSLACAAVTSLTLVGVAWGAWRLGHEASGWLLSADAGWQHVASISLGVVLSLALFIAGALTVPNLLLAPLQDPLSEATEERCGGFTPPPFTLGAAARGTLEALFHTVLRLGFMAIGLVLLFPLNLVPVGGNVAWVLLSSLWSMFWLSVEQLSNPMARHLRPFRQVVRALRRRLPLSLGFGAAVWALLWIPVLNFFLMPVAVVAATLLYRGLEQAGALDVEP